MNASLRLTRVVWSLEAHRIVALAQSEPYHFSLHDADPWTVHAERHEAQLIDFPYTAYEVGSLREFDHVPSLSLLRALPLSAFAEVELRHSCSGTALRALHSLKCDDGGRDQPLPANHRLNGNAPGLLQN